MFPHPDTHENTCGDRAPSARVLGEDRVPCQWAWIHLHPKSKTRVSVVVVVIATQLILTRLSQRLQSRPEESLGGIFHQSCVPFCFQRLPMLPTPDSSAKVLLPLTFLAQLVAGSFFWSSMFGGLWRWMLWKRCWKKEQKLSLSLSSVDHRDVWSRRQCSSRWPHVTLHWGLMMGGRARPGHDGIVARSAVPTSALRVSTKSLKRASRPPSAPALLCPFLQREAISLGKYCSPEQWLDLCTPWIQFFCKVNNYKY